MKITQYLTIMIAFCATSSYAQPGSPSKVPVTDEGVRDAASFGFTQLYNPQAASYQIISATEQVVAGLKYDIVLAVTPQNGQCTLIRVVVVNRFGDYLLLTHNPEGSC